MSEKFTTAYIVGAGSSAELGFPLGGELRTKICRALDIRYSHDAMKPPTGDNIVRRAIELASEATKEFTHQELVAAALRIRDGLHLDASIDEFIDKQRGDKPIELCSKLAIARCILQAEAACVGSRYFGDGSLNAERLDQTWLPSLFRVLFDRCREKDVVRRLGTIAFIVFNYDRVLEHFLSLALCKAYGMPQDKAENIVRGITIVHPYGRVGSLAWQRRRPTISFGEEPSPETLWLVGNELRTFSEGSDPELQSLTAGEVVSRSEKLVFLGFGFHRMNLDLLFPGGNGVNELLQRKILASAFGVPPPRLDWIRQVLARLGGFHEEIITLRADLKSKNLLEEHAHELWFT